METHEVGRALGLASVTLRLWERRKLIGPIKKDGRGWRNWTAADLADCKRVLARLHGEAPTAR